MYLGASRVSMSSSEINGDSNVCTVVVAIDALARRHTRDSTAPHRTAHGKVRDMLTFVLYTW
jgi:hypothetical protein